MPEIARELTLGDVCFWPSGEVAENAQNTPKQRFGTRRPSTRYALCGLAATAGSTFRFKIRSRSQFYRTSSRARPRRLARAADLEFALEPGLVILIRRLLLLPSVLRLSLVGWFGGRSVERADDDFSVRPRMLPGRRLNRLCVVARSRAESVPRGGRHSGCRRTTISQRATIREHQCGKEEQRAFRNHRDHFTALQ
jgi:hypothetical protein